MSKLAATTLQYRLLALFTATTYCGLTFAMGRWLGMGVCVPLLYLGIAVGLAMTTGRLFGGVDRVGVKAKNRDGLNL
jgi:hypothetical protein